MEKWEQTIKTAVNPALPIEIEDRISRTLHQLPRKERKTRLRYALPAAVLAVCFLFGAAAVSPAVAGTMGSVPVIGSIFEKVGNIGQRKASQQGLVSLLGQEVVMNGESITITDILYDGSSIHIGYRGDSDKSFLAWDVDVWINGEHLKDYSGGGGGRILEDGTFAGIYTVWAEQQLPNSFTLGLSSRDELWKVEIPVKQQGEQQTYLINETREWRDRTLIYDKIGFYPASTVLSIRWPRGYSVNYQIFDDQGRVLQPFGDSSRSRPDQNLVTHQFIYEPVNTIPTSLTIKPYFDNGFAPGKATQQWKGNSFELSQGEAGSIKIENIEQENGRFTMTYEVTGDLTYQRAYFVWLENGHGERYETIHSPQRVEGSVNRYQATFASQKANEDIMVVTQQFQPIAYLEDLAITIEMND